ncbi:ABC transporter substrate-binding protein [Aquisalimonas lutea]|uniref:ABC transporter substrate-binding protein n=1 Tax=Aquisalimonas lutea TaxID=1327750 RepID=UPI0025B50C4D|nr:ABC transporter substrate-binding protein [Aquisalimonas lutea]MDN3519464.1 ABC transporter substrate-binding protein [Aquisalimonas lutea]
MISRRRLLAAAAAAPAATLMRPVRSRSRTLELATPPGLPAVYLHRLVQQDPVLEGFRLALRPWRNPDQLRIWIASGRIAAAASPTNVTANLYNRGVDVGLVDVTVRGMLHVLVAGRSTANGLASLRGLRVGIPFRDDMPDVVFRRLLEAAGIDPVKDLEAVYLGTPVEAAQMFLARRLDALVLPEPAATLVRERAELVGIPLATLDLQAVWADRFGGEPRLPQAGLLCERRLAEREPGLVQALVAASADAVAWVTAHPGAAAEAASEVTGLPASAVATALGRARLGHRTARAARPELEAFFSRMAEMDPELIGGTLPGDDFYLA